MFKEVNPAVVTILATGHGYSKTRPGEKVVSKGLGSGFVVGKNGLVMTAAHVVQVADTVVVEFLNGKKIGARVQGSVALADVALLQLDKVPSGLVSAPLGDSDKVSVGDEVFVIGAPYGVSHTLTVGHMSGRRKPEGRSSQLLPIELLQTDAAINSGNSGGPMFNTKGEVIGIVSHILSKSGGFEGLGFAVSMNTANALLMQEKSFWTGLEFIFLSGPLAKALNVPQEAGLLVQRVADKSLGYFMLLEPSKIPVKIGRDEFFIGGDIILDVGGARVSTDVEDMRRIRRTIMNVPPGRRIKAKVLRGGKILELFTAK
ncbi:MAG: trypsin-like peptidase domain-containing protein [Deltaproteobacteria bacterium]|nr:trypsin-like peptidase domain-containing protein [Deltaproteobacteria bacterium]